MTDHWFHIPVNPEPWRVGPVGTGRRDGRMYAYVGQDQQLASFQEAVAENVREQWGDRPMLTGKLKMHIYLWRHQAEYTTQRQVQHRKHEADATNMQKATEDAFQGIVFKNDRDNVMVGSVLMGQGPDVFGQIAVHIETAEENYQDRYLQKMPDHILDKLADARVPDTLPLTEAHDDTPEDIF